MKKEHWQTSSYPEPGQRAVLGEWVVPGVRGAHFLYKPSQVVCWSCSLEMESRCNVLYVPLLVPLNCLLCFVCTHRNFWRAEMMMESINGI